MTKNDGRYVIDDGFVPTPEVPPNPMLDDRVEAERMLTLTRDSINNPDAWPPTAPPA